jgi:hypothetical protein
MMRDLWGFALCLGFLLLSACGADRSLEDYRKSLSHAYNARVNPVVGSYSGSITSALDGAAIGNLDLTIMSDTVLQVSQDGVSTEQQSIIRGSFSYRGLVNANIDYSFAYYNPDSHVFQLNVKGKDTSGADHVMNLEGNLEKDQFTGILMVDTFQGFGGKVSLKKNAILQNRLPDLNGARARELNASNSAFVGFWPDDLGVKHQVYLTLKSLETSPLLQLMDVFSPKHRVNAEFVFWKQDAKGVLRREFSQIFSSQLDDLNNDSYLSGVQSANFNGMPVITRLNCSRALDSSGLVSKLRCIATGMSGTLSFPAEFTPGAGLVNGS